MNEYSTPEQILERAIHATEALLWVSRGGAVRYADLFALREMLVDARAALETSSWDMDDIIGIVPVE